MLVTFMVWSRAFSGCPPDTAAPSVTSSGTFTGRIVMCESGTRDLLSTFRSTVTLAPSQLQPFLRRKNSCCPLQNGSTVVSTS